MMYTVFVFITVIFGACFNIFVIATKGSAINRAITNIPVNLIKEAVIDHPTDEYLYYDKETLEGDVIDYYKVVLDGYVDSFYISFYYYIYEEIMNMYRIDLSDYAQNVQINVSTTFYKNYTINKYLTFELEEMWR